MRDAADLSIVVLSYNRREPLGVTLGHLQPWADAGAQIIVVDNASGDGSAEFVERCCPWVKLLRLERNVAIAGFNRGAAEADRTYLLILDDDSWPDPHSLDHALAHIRAHPDCGGVMLHRLHPRTGEYEWPFESQPVAAERWPDMGCGNLLRRAAWEQVGGYEEQYFLYRNDTDLALKLLGAGFDVHFNPRWHVLHDSPIARRRTPRWFYLSTRNWVWLCRRHGRRGSGLTGVLLGWLWAHRLARWSPARHFAAARGALSGCFRSPPPLPESVRPDGRALRRLIQLKRRLRNRPRPSTP